jgi:hypothetical protein
MSNADLDETLDTEPTELPDAMPEETLAKLESHQYQTQWGAHVFTPEATMYQILIALG